MPQDRDLSLEAYQISRYAYRELKYFCKQYDEKKRRLNAVQLYKESSDFLSSHRRFLFEEKESLKHDVSLIEEAAAETAGELGPYILQNVTQGIAFEYMPVPCGRRQFYTLRRQFFLCLYQKRRTENLGSCFKC